MLNVTTRHAFLPYKSGTTKIGSAGKIIKSTPGRLRGIGGVNTSASAQYYLVVCNLATAPANDQAAVAAVPLDKTTSWTGSANSIDFGSEGLILTAGISYAISTTPEKVTLPNADDCFVWAIYE